MSSTGDLNTCGHSTWRCLSAAAGYLCTARRHFRCPEHPKPLLRRSRDRLLDDGGRWRRLCRWRRLYGFDGTMPSGPGGRRCPNGKRKRL